MFYLEPSEELDKAIERCKQKHPKVRIKKFGHYLVKGTSDWYHVFCSKDTNGRKIVSCDCQTKDGLICYCGIAAATLHIYLAKQRVINSKE